MSMADMPFARALAARLARGFAGNENGATAIEYALIATIIGAMLVVTVGGISDSMQSHYSEISSSIDDASGN